MEHDLARSHQLDHGGRFARGNVRLGADDHTRVRRREPPALIRPVDVPLPLHPHVGVEHHVFGIGGERDHQVLAVGLDRFHGAAHDLPPRGRRCHLRRDELESGDKATAERAAEDRRGAEDRVAFGHRPLDARDAPEVATGRPREAGLTKCVTKR